MATAHHTHPSPAHESPSLLPQIAKREAELQQRLEKSEERAREIVDAAKAEARRHLQEQETAVNEEVAGIRREREAKRQAAFENTVAAAEARLTEVRGKAMQRVDAVAGEVMQLFMPRTGGE